MKAVIYARYSTEEQCCQVYKLNFFIHDKIEIFIVQECAVSAFRLLMTFYTPQVFLHSPTSFSQNVLFRNPLFMGICRYAKKLYLSTYIYLIRQINDYSGITSSIVTNTRNN